MLPRLLGAAVVAGCAAAFAGAGPGPVPGADPQIFLLDLRTRELRQLTTGPAAHDRAAWAPAGTRIAYVASEGDRSAIEILDLRRGTRRVVVRSSVDWPDTVVWSPARDVLAFSMRNEERIRIATVRADGSHATTLARYPEANLDDPGPTWSPEGSQLAFVQSFDARLEPGRTRGPGPPGVSVVGADLKLVIASADGHKRRRPTSGPADESDPRWSPGGRAIVLVRETGDELGLVSVPVGSGRTRLLLGRLIDVQADWSPTGARIALAGVTVAGDRRYHLHVLDLRGHKTVFRSRFEVSADRPAWSPDGRRVAFSTFDGDIQAIEPGTRRITTLARLPGAEIRDLAWSSDGRSLAFTAWHRPPD